jgi:Transposase DDE domain
LAHANEHRDWRIYADFAQVLIAAARDLYRGESFGVELSETVYAFDSTTIDLCLSLFPWGKFRRRKSAVKLHTLLDLRGSIPTHVYVTGGQVHDVSILDQLLPEAGAFTCSIAVMWTSPACMSWPKLVPSSSLTPKRICSSTVAAHFPSNDQQDCEATKPFC